MTNHEQLIKSGRISHFSSIAKKKVEALIKMKGDNFCGFGDVTRDYIYMSFKTESCKVSIFGRVSWVEAAQLT